MVVDSSAVIAVLQKEKGWEALREALLAAERCLISAPTLVETSMVFEAWRGEVGAKELDALLAVSGIEIVPFNAEQAALARAAFRRFGKRRHPANLNFGDCFAYAAAKRLGEPLLFTGEDFRQTDVVPALSA